MSKPELRSELRTDCAPDCSHLTPKEANEIQAYIAAVVILGVLCLALAGMAINAMINN